MCGEQLHVVIRRGFTAVCIAQRRSFAPISEGFISDLLDVWTRLAQLCGHGCCRTRTSKRTFPFSFYSAVWNWASDSRWVSKKYLIKKSIMNRLCFLSPAPSTAPSSIWHVTFPSLNDQRGRQRLILINSGPYASISSQHQCQISKLSITSHEPSTLRAEDIFLNMIERRPNCCGRLTTRQLGVFHVCLRCWRRVSQRPRLCCSNRSRLPLDPLVIHSDAVSKSSLIRWKEASWSKCFSSLPPTDWTLSRQIL